MQPSYAPASPYPQTGEVLDGKYRIERLLGEGGMGAVAKATHLLRRAPVALKFMSPAVLQMTGAVERFVNEGVAASQIDSDHVVKIFDVGRMASGAPYLVMEYLEGCDLAQLLEREGPILATPRAINFTLQILRALQTAHAAGIVHRDMKPSNCFIVTKDGDPDFIKLVDFGISKVKSADEAPAAHLTRTNSALGTPLYMSPEQARSPRDVDHRTDLYSVGAILYEMLTARTPYTAPSGEYTEILFKIFTMDPEPIKAFRPDLPDGLAAAIHRALTRDLGQRFGSALDMAEALAPFGDERGAGMIARMRGTRPPSNVPAPQSSLALTPSHVGSRATPAEATAQTYMANAESVPPRAVPTDVGVTREHPPLQPGQAPAKPRAAIFAAAAFVSLLIGGAGVVVVKSHPSAAGTATVGPDLPGPIVKPTTPVVSTAVAMTTLAPPAPPAPPSAESASASASASPKPPVRPVVNPQAASPATPAPPRQLGDLKFH
jgi:serine/threonine protein kinase